MKRKIAAFANGWSDEYLMVALKGIRRCAKEHDLDVYMYVNYASSDGNVEVTQGEINILNLPILENYDGIFLLGNTLNNAGELDILREKIKKTHVPAVCMEYELEDMDCICTDNYSGMHELCEHLITEHNVRRIVWVSGVKGNKENEERFRAVTDCVKEHGLQIRDEDIIYGDFSYYAIQFSAADWLDGHDLPDAFVCANDVMALGIISQLQNRGYQVPEDVIVTGFDNIKSTSSFVPALTTVDRDWSDRTYDGLSHLVDLMDGKPSCGKKSFLSKMCVRASCGCGQDVKLLPEQMLAINKVYTAPFERTMFDWHLTGVDEATSNRFTMEQINEGLKEFFKTGASSYEGDTFCICLDESFVNSIYAQTEPRALGYSERMHVLYAKRDGEHLPYTTIKTSYVFPVFSKPEESGNIYYIAPLYGMNGTIGYAVFKNHESVLDTYFLYSWIRHLRIGLLRCRQNIIMNTMNQKLNEISLLDDLSGLLNRKGYERKGIPMLEEIKKHGKPALMMVVDINKMKMINDRYGHLQGDLAIRLVAKAIKETIPESWCGIRYGGDEFVIIGENYFVDDGSILKGKLCAAVEHEASSLMIPYELSVSVGSVAIDPSENISIDEYFRRADDAMYEMKKRNHEQREE